MRALSIFLKACNLNIRHISKFRTSVIFQNTDKMENFQGNPYFEKYQEKLKKTQVSNPDEFKNKLDALLEKKKLERLPINDPADNSSNPSLPKTLNDVMNVNLLQEKSTEEISELWKEYHEEKDCVFATISSSEYDIIKEKTKEFPNFIFPVPREGGYEFFLQKWVGDVCHFTSLSNYQSLQDNAPTCLSLHHFPDLVSTKDIVLMRGFPDLNSISIHESQLLSMQIKLYYGQQSGIRFNLVRIFNNHPQSFKHMDLVLEFENYKKDSLAKKEFTFEGTPV